MSIKVSSLVWGINLSVTLKIVCLCLADYANDQGNNIFPKNQTIAEKTGLNKRTVQKALRELEEINIINQVGYSKYGTKKYQINLEHLSNLSSGRSVPPEIEDQDCENSFITNDIRVNHSHPEGESEDTLSQEGMNYGHPRGESEDTLSELEVTDYHPGGDTDDIEYAIGVNLVHPGGGSGTSDPSINHQVINHHLTRGLQENKKILEPGHESHKRSFSSNQVFQYIFEQLNADIPKGAHTYHLLNARADFLPNENGGEILAITCKDKQAAEWCRNHLDLSVLKMVRGITNDDIQEVTWCYEQPSNVTGEQYQSYLEKPIQVSHQLQKEKNPC
ncbi:MAG: hypothetical protein C0410_08535 [Anaerolinea sp.]|nr:hypothetical protein [Anaerolinea sp.]